MKQRWIRRAAWLAAALAAPVGAAPYWVAWEGDDFPENEGWQRVLPGSGPAKRTLANGIMTMDGLADRQIADYYRMDRPLSPEVGETFIIQWRLRVRQVVSHPLTPFDHGFEVFSDDNWSLAFVFGTDFIRSFHEGVELTLEPSVFHEFEVRTEDMRAYNLWIDNHLVFSGSFWEPTFTSSRIEWGDYSRGSASLADWDYFRFGVVPEPALGTGILWTMGVLVRRTR